MAPIPKFLEFFFFRIDGNLNHFCAGIINENIKIIILIK